MPTIRIGIAGATGYAGEELIRLLLHHPRVQLAYLAASAKWERPRPASVVFPKFARQLDLPIEVYDPARAAAACDAMFLALPHGTAMSVAPGLVEAGARVIRRMAERGPALYQRVASDLDDLQRDSYQGKPLNTDLKGRYSYRVGSYRLVYLVRQQKLLVLIIDIGHRRGIYR